MPDLEMNQLANALLKSMSVQFRKEGIQIGQRFPQPLLNEPAEPMGRDVENEFDGSFATGYDTGTGTTILPFTLDVSILYGDGLTGDILTG